MNIYNSLLIVFVNFCSILGFIYFFYLIFTSNKNIIYKNFAFFFLINALWNISNLINILKKDLITNNSIKYLFFFLFLFYYFYISNFFYGKKTNKTRLIYPISFLFFIFGIFLAFYNSEYFIKYILFILIIHFMHSFSFIVFDKINNKNNKIQNFLALNYLISILISIIIVLTYSLFVKKDIFNLNYSFSLSELLYFLQIILPIFFNSVYLVGIRKILLFEIKNGSWQYFIMNNVDASIIYLNQLNQIVYVNDQFSNLTGYDLKMIKNKDIKDILNLQKSVLILPNREKINVEYQFYKTKSSSKIKSLITLKALKNEYEIEIIKKNEEEYKNKLFHYEELNDKLLSIMPGIILFLSKDGKIINFNQDFLDIFNLKKEEAKSLFIYDFFEKVEFLNIERKDLKKEESIDSITNKINGEKVAIDKKIFIIDCKNLIDTNIDTNIDKKNEYLKKLIKEDSLNKTEENIILRSSYIIILRDITDIYIAQDKLKNNTMILMNFFRLNPLPICFIDFNSLIKITNKSFAESFKNFKSFNFLNFIEEIKDLNNFKKQMLCLGDFIFNNKDFESIKRFDFLKFIEDNKEKNLIINKINIYSIFYYKEFQSLSYYFPYQFVLVFIDKTSLILKKIELIENIENSKNLSDNLDKLINNINHEIRTPINIINGFLELIEIKDNQELLNSKIDILRNSTNIITNIINEILSVTSYSLNENNIVEIKLKPLLLDYKKYIETECKFQGKINVPEKEVENVRVNLMIFKKLINYIIDSYKEYDFLNLTMEIRENYKNQFISSRSFILILKEKRENLTIKDSNLSSLRIIVLKYLTFLLNGRINFENSSEFNFSIKIPMK